MAREQNRPIMALCISITNASERYFKLFIGRILYTYHFIGAVRYCYYY